MSDNDHRSPTIAELDEQFQEFADLIGLDPDDDTTAVDPPAPLLPLLSLLEAQELLPLLAAVRDGGEPDREAAGWLLSNLAGRVPSAG